MSISQLYTAVPLSTSCTDFTVNSKTFGEPRDLPPVLFMIEALNKAFLCRLFSVSCKQDASDYEQNAPEYTYQWNETVFSLRIGQSFLFQGLPEDIQSKIVYIYSVINEYSLRSRDVHSTPLTQMIRFWIPPMMLSDRSAHTAWFHAKTSERATLQNLWRQRVIV